MTTRAYAPEYEAEVKELWQKGIAAGQLWDTGGPHKALIHLVDSKSYCVNSRTVLVPGCGRGYDAVFLAERGGQVVGLDLVDIAIREAQSYLKSYNIENDGNVQVTYKTEDFFDHEGVYDCGYDHTFFCVVQPDLRRRWAEKWAELLIPGGLLLVIVFPITTQREHRPPWPIDPSLVTEMLCERFDLVSEAKIPSALSIPRRIGRESVMIWKRKTHGEL